MNIPTVNIVMSTNPKDILTFLGSETLALFVQDAQGIGTKDTLVFNNGPASNFLSFSHQVGMTKDDGPKVKIEFVDPQEVFEKKMSSFTVEGLMPVESQLTSYQIKKLQQKVRDTEIALEQKEQAAIDAQRAAWKSGTSEDFARAKDLRDQADTIEQALEAAEEELDDAIDDGLFDGGEIDDDDIGAEDDAARKAVQDFNASLLKQSVWITYGIGDRLENWCPPMVFGQAVGAEYDVGSGQPRILRLTYSGMEAMPGSAVPTSILKTLGKRVICTGRSRRLFNDESMKAAKDFYDKLNTEGNIDHPYFKDYLSYSIHDVITGVLTQYIQKATARKNVLVAFPDLDKVLKGLYDENVEDAKDWDIFQVFTDNTALELGNYLEAARTFFESLGMKITESIDGVQSVNSDIFSELENECTSPSQMVEVLKKKIIHVVLSSTIESESYMTVLEKVFKKIKQGAEQAFGESENIEDYEVAEYVINDYIMLSALARKGLIDTANEPLYVFGSKKFIEDFIFGNIAYKTEDGKPSKFVQIKKKNTDNQSIPPHIESEINSRVSPLDRLKGLDQKYIKAMAFYQEPNMSNSPFGFPAISNSIQEEIDEIQVNDFTMPIFAMGTRNANTMELKLDFNKQYLAALLQVPTRMTVQTKIKGIITDEDKEKSALNLVNDFSDLNLGQLGKEIEKGSGPNFEKFKALVDPMKDQGAWFWGTDRDDDETFDGLLEVFEAINEKFAEEFKQAASEDTDQEDYYKKIYELLLGLVNDFPRAEEIEPIGANGKMIISKLAHTKKLLAETAIIGSVKTLPLFQLSNLKRIAGKSCYVYSREPRFQGVELQNSGSTFYSGLYSITGFRHTINKNNVFSEFRIHRPSKI